MLSSSKLTWPTQSPSNMTANIFKLLVQKWSCGIIRRCIRCMMRTALRGSGLNHWWRSPMIWVWSCSHHRLTRQRWTTWRQSMFPRIKLHHLRTPITVCFVKLRSLASLSLWAQVWHLWQTLTKAFTFFDQSTLIFSLQFSNALLLTPLSACFLS